MRALNAFTVGARSTQDRTFVPNQCIMIWKKTSSTFEELFKARNPVGNPIPINVDPFPLLDDPPDEDLIIRALHHMQHNQQPGLSGMTVKDIYDFWNEAPEAWQMVVEIVQTAMLGHEIPLAFSRAILCLLPKTKAGKFQDIVLLESLYKLCATILYLRWQEGTQFHPGTHGFRQGHGTGAAILEAKLGMFLRSQ